MQQFHISFTYMDIMNNNNFSLSVLPFAFRMNELIEELLSK